MANNGQFLIGSILERKPSKPATPPTLATTSSHGFPTVQHRSKSAFLRNREAARKLTSEKAEERPTAPPVVVPSRPEAVKDEALTNDDWRAQVSRDNEARVANMTDEQREEEKREILERFGANIGDILHRARQARERHSSKDRWPTQRSKPLPPPSDADSEDSFQKMEEVPISDDEPAPSRSSERGFSPPPALLSPESRPTSRAGRKLRFAELNSSDVYVYESHPPSPRRQPLALPPALNDGTAVSLGEWKGKMAPTLEMSAANKPTDSSAAQDLLSQATGESAIHNEPEPDEGSAEFIRRRYFPNASPNDPNLAWMQGNTGGDSQPSSLIRFDLHGNVIPLSVATQLPTHLGLHHHAEGSTAGYTLDDIFLLSRSTVPGQRASMLGLLAHIAINLGKATKTSSPQLEELIPQSETIRKRVVAAGVEAMGERGNVGARAIEVVWAALVAWDEDTADIEGIELQQETDSTIASLPMDHFLPQVATLLSQGDNARESLSQLLAVLHRLARESNHIAEKIMVTPKLLVSIFQTFIPIPPNENGALPEPAAIQFLITLASASRNNAEALIDPVNALFRFVFPLPPFSHLPVGLATTLLTLTLEMYTTLAKYGLYSNIATTAMQQFMNLSRYVLSDSCESPKLQLAWLDLINAWTVCAVDPHRTKPEHDILWSQIVGWDWHGEIENFVQGLRSDKNDWLLWRAAWEAQAQWLEGSKVNSVKGGEVERLAFINAVAPEFHQGQRRQVLESVLDVLDRDLGAEDIVKNLSMAASHSSLLSAAIRLWLACLPPHLEGCPPSPPFELPFPRISAVCAKMVMHSLWNPVIRKGVDPCYAVHARQLSDLLASYISLSRRLPGVSEELWMAQAFAILLRLLPGDEDVANDLMVALTELLTSEWMNQRQIVSPNVVWERGGLSILKPFLSNTIVPNTNDRIAPLQITPKSIATSSTLRLIATPRSQNVGLPMNHDWILTPINHVLRSADSEVLKNLPEGWDASEVEVIRATLLLSRLSRDVLAHFSLDRFTLTREEAIFACMRVFMLEHGQPQNDSSEEVFRDAVVETLMKQLLEPYAFGPSHQPEGRVEMLEPTLEQVAARFLSSSTPFFQFYTDFVALYDAISFSDPVFAQLLLPPTSMRYALDYRKHLWEDYSHILKTIRTPCEKILSANIKEYLYPVESDPQVIGAYLRALLKDKLEGFIHFVAVHHIAANIWPDLRDSGNVNESRASKLLKAIATQGSVEVVRDVVMYRQTLMGPTWLPGQCFEHVSGFAESRLAWIKDVGDSATITCIEGLLKSVA